MEQAVAITEQAKGIAVVDQNSRQIAADFYTTISSMRKDIVAFHKDLKANAHATWKMACKREEVDLLPVDEALIIVNKAISVYDTKVREQRKAEEERIYAEAEKGRLKIEKQIADAQAKGNDKKAEKLEEKMMSAITPTFAPMEKTVKTSTGSVTSSEDIEVTVSDLKELIKSVAEGIVPITIIDIKLGTLKSWIKSSGIKSVSGVEIKPKTKLTARGA